MCHCSKDENLRVQKKERFQEDGFEVFRTKYTCQKVRRIRRHFLQNGSRKSFLEDPETVALKELLFEGLFCVVQIDDNLGCGSRTRRHFDTL